MGGSRGVAWQFCRFCDKIGNMATSEFSPLIEPALQGSAAIKRTVAMRLVLRLAEHWGLRRSDVPALLATPARTARDWAESDRGPLDAGVRERISHLLAIYDGLHAIFGDARFADRWIHETNRAFGGRRPADLLLSGSFTALVQVRLYIERALAQ